MEREEEGEREREEEGVEMEEGEEIEASYIEKKSLHIRLQTEIVHHLYLHRHSITHNLNRGSAAVRAVMVHCWVGNGVTFCHSLQA